MESIYTGQLDDDVLKQLAEFDAGQNASYPAATPNLDQFMDENPIPDSQGASYLANAIQQYKGDENFTPKDAGGLGYEQFKAPREMGGVPPNLAPLMVGAPQPKMAPKMPVAAPDAPMAAAAPKPAAPQIDQRMRDYISDMEAAQEDSRQKRMGVGFAASMADAVSAMTGAKAPTAALQMAQESANAPVKDLREKRAAQRDQLAFQEELRKSDSAQQAEDPNSELNARFRKVIAPMAKQIGIDPSSVSYADYQRNKDVYSALYQAKIKEQENTKQQAFELKKEGLKNDKESKKAQLDSDKDLRERTVNGVGVFPGKEDRKAFLDKAVDVQNGVAGIDELLQISNKPMKSISLDDRARAKTLTIAL